MKHTIYAKLLISYLIYGVIAFFIICTFTQHLTTDYIEKQADMAEELMHIAILQWYLLHGFLWNFNCIL